jgi:DNA-binding protein
MDIPTNYEIQGPPREIQRQIGNAAPPRLIEEIVRAMMQQLDMTPVESDAETTSTVLQADGGEVETDDELVVGTDRSPWEYAAQVIPALKQRDSVTIAGRGKRVAQAIDVGEILRRRVVGDLSFTLTENVVEDPDGSKSDRLSELVIDISTE